MPVGDDVKRVFRMEKRNERHQRGIQKREEE